MIEAKCPECGHRYFGWALLDEDHHYCSKCGAKLSITRDGHPLDKQGITSTIKERVITILNTPIPPSSGNNGRKKDKKKSA